MLATWRRRCAAPLSAISRRVALAEAVADAIVAAADTPSITELLNNRSAQIREETLDRLVDRAESVPQWHEPLVKRPALSARAVLRLSRIVAHSLLAELNRRGDLDAETAAELSERVAVRLEREEPGAPGRGTNAERDEPERADSRADRLHREGTLNESAVLDALRRGDREFVLRALASLSGLPDPVVGKAVSLASAKGVTAMAWQAGLSMRTAVQLQLRLARIPPPKVLHPRGGEDFPLTDAEMRWQIEFFGG